MQKHCLKVLAVNDPAVVGYKQLGILEQFSQLTGIDVVFDIVDWEDYHPRYQAVLTGQQEYDLFMVAGHLWLPALIKNQQIRPFEIDTNNFMKKVVEEISDQQKTYLLPAFCDGHLLVYRKSWFIENQLALPGEFVTIDELLHVTHELYKCVGSQAIALKAADSELFLDMLPYIRSTGVEPVAVNGKEISDLKLLDSGIKKYQQMLQWADPASRVYGNQEIKEKIQRNQTALAITWNGQLGTIYTEECQNKADLGFAQLVGSWNVTWGFALNHRSQQPKEAKQLLTYLASESVTEQIGEFSGSPVRKPETLTDCAKFPWYQSHFELVEQTARRLPKSALLQNSMAEILAYQLQKIGEAK